MKNIAIFASGGGSNAEQIIQHFKKSTVGKVCLIVSNKPNAGVLERAKNHNIPVHILNRDNFYPKSSNPEKKEDILLKLDAYSIDFVVLAGFLWLIPSYLVKAYTNRIVNIHPALLPQFGGKGMYGMNVHRAVKEAGVKETGMTIHFVNEQYDDGAIIFQGICKITSSDSPNDIARKVLELEHKYYPQVIEQVLEKL